MVRNVFLLVSLLIGSSMIGIGQERQFSSAKLIASSDDKMPLTHVKYLDVEIREDENIYIYLADVFTSSVLIVRRQGEQLRIVGTIGQSGKGPGEFLTVDNLQIVEEQSLLVYDRKIGRVSIFDLETRELNNSFNISSIGRQGHFPMQFYALNNNSNIQYYALSKLFFRAGDNLGSKRTVLLQQFNAKGSLLKDSLLVKSASDAFVVKRGANMAVNPQPILGRKSVFRFRESTIFYGFTGKKNIEVYNPAGDLINTIRLDLNALEVTDSDIQLALDKESKMMQEEKKFIREAFLKQVPEYWPYYQNYIIDEKNRLWIGLSNHLDDEKRVWHIFNFKGELLKKTKLPSNFSIFKIKDNYIIGELLDDKFRSFVQIYKLFP